MVDELVETQSWSHPLLNRVTLAPGFSVYAELGSTLRFSPSEDPAHSSQTAVRKR